MKVLLEKLAALERASALEKGAYDLFGLFLREDSPNKWDFLVAAPWIEADRRASLDYLSAQLRERLLLEELLKISRIVVIEQDNPGLQAIHKAVRVEHGLVELEEPTFFGLSIEKAYVITSQPTVAALAPLTA